MASTSRSPNLRAVKAAEDHFSRRIEVLRYAEINPRIPKRLSEIVNWLDAHMRSAGLTFSVQEAKEAPTHDVWAERFGLTPAETRLAAHLLNGGTPASYAVERRLSPHTVRNQLRSIYAKTDTNRQVALLQLLLRASGKNP